MLKYFQRNNENGSCDDGDSTASVDERKKRKIRNDSLEDPDMKSWAEKRNQAVYCKVCNKELKATAGKIDLVSHSQTRKYMDASNAIANQAKINEIFSMEKYGNKKAEIRLALFIVEHNLPFAVADHLTKVCQSSFIDSEITSKIKLGRTKANAIVRNVIGSSQFSVVCDLLQNNLFSLCIDESTDFSNKKSLCMTVRVCLDFEIHDLFFGLVEVDQCDASSLYNLIVKHFKDNINYRKNMIGFAADGAAVMTGKKHSVAQIFKKEILNLFIIKCVCHSLALCSSYACLKLPSAVETLARDIYNYLSNSPKRCNQFNKIQSLLDIKPKKILHPSQTRWLSLEAVVNSLLHLYESLKIYFSFAVNIDHIDTAKSILNNLNDTNKIYLSFLKYILGIINNINRIFQSEATEIHNLYIQMEKLIQIVMSNFLKQDLIQNDKILSVDYKNPMNFQNYESVYLGIYAAEVLSNTSLSPFDVQKITNDCIQFYIELLDQVFKRFDFEGQMKSLNIISPNLILSGHSNSIFNIAKYFPNLFKENEKQDLDSEFRELKLFNFNNILNKEEITLICFWKKISEIKRQNQDYAFPTLTKFVQNIMILPHSSANVERIFSQVNLNKTKVRNRLENESLVGILLTKDDLKLKKSHCFDTSISPDLLKSMSADIYA